MAARRHRDRPVDFATRILDREAPLPRAKVLLFVQVPGRVAA